jgi:hypothetical protein
MHPVAAVMPRAAIEALMLPGSLSNARNAK